MGYIYIIQEVGTHYFKVGHSINPAERLRALQTANPRELRLVHMSWCENAGKEEKSIHRALRKRGCWRRGEWFESIGGLNSITKALVNCFEPEVAEQIPVRVLKEMRGKRGGKLYEIAWKGTKRTSIESRKWFNQSAYTKSLLDEWKGM